MMMLVEQFEIWFQSRNFFPGKIIPRECFIVEFVLELELILIDTHNFHRSTFVQPKHRRVDRRACSPTAPR